MKNLRSFSQKPAGQVLLATLLFCFIFVALFAGLFNAGTAYIMKERSRRATDLTVLSAGAVYANGLQWVRVSNAVDMALAAWDIGVIMLKIGPMLASVALGPETIPPIIAAAVKADPKTREKVGQKLQKYLFGIDQNFPGAYPALIHTIAYDTAKDNQLSDALLEPTHFYNYETGSLANTVIPNMALRFRTAAELIPEPGQGPYSLRHDGEKIYFSSDEVEPAHNPKHPKQMRVRHGVPPDKEGYVGWWVHREKDSDSTGELGPLSKFGKREILNHLKDFLKKFKLDVTDREDPPCHTFTMVGQFEGKVMGKTRTFYQLSEARIETEGLAAWDTAHPIETYLQKANLESFPVLKSLLKNLPFFDRWIGLI